MADPMTISVFKSYHSVAVSRMNEYEKNVTDKSYTCYALGRLVGAYECLTYPIPAGINEKYNSAMKRAAQLNLP